MSDQAILRITREIKQIQQSADVFLDTGMNIPLMDSLLIPMLAIAVSYEDSDIRNVRAVILGPPETPYQFGFFEFHIKFPKDYPASPPTVRAATTNGGTTRFNPNIYAGGKVCLSILGTWTGESGEQWSSAQGLESVLLSIQSLMSSNPYENEPGYEHAKSDSDRENMVAYTEKIRHETLRLAVIEPLETSLDILPDGSTKSPGVKISEEDSESWSDDEIIGYENPFTDLRKRRFLWYYESYMRLIDREERYGPTSRNRKFQKMPFESAGNTMEGHFDYIALRQRLIRIKERIMEETEGWHAQGLQAQKEELGIAVNLQRQYEQIVEDLKHQKNYTIDLNIVDGNPFVWIVTYFGRPTTPLDGGIFKMKIHLSPRFPEEQPRVFMETSIFHIRVSKEKVLCYLPKRTEEMRYHIEAIIASLEEESPPYDPRATINPDASKLFWGSPEERKQYRRTLRRDVEKSIEDTFE
ncbi:hypothetical protein P175DRAFT_0524292 [Aspergillus ochraceoroseus IBT 24754]|uniref:Ubiquitin-conjugating enzyme E2 Z n=1 Tax=Aspergillus ochraceoroseus IBT 24754 TaxID=1392256 RepID=A0A2T5LUP8_9EURO|nr:uncharacterized protein P175DRAFT_0524292 [Aspergillus ochraceoroseus IBT 24754]PTU20008.1 hypothetical protein P175DRAFT_0524292 [Aspergillus ochraceoroseus IBT 24754]